MKRTIIEGQISESFTVFQNCVTVSRRLQQSTKMSLKGKNYLIHLKVPDNCLGFSLEMDEYTEIIRRQLKVPKILVEDSFVFVGLENYQSIFPFYAGEFEFEGVLGVMFSEESLWI